MYVRYVGGRLAPWFRTGPNDRFCERLAERGGKRFTEAARAMSPVGEYVDGRVGGRLKAGWRELPVTRGIRMGRPSWESGTENSVHYAIYVENGTCLWGPKHAKYLIVPRKPGGWLRWIDPETMEPVFARVVHHPGIKPQHITQRAAAAVELSFDSMAAPLLKEWAREVEGQNHTLGGLRVIR
jgi:hypothetical protein